MPAGSIPPTQALDPVQVLADLDRALASRDGDEVERAVVATFQVGLRSEFVSPLVRLLRVPDHHKHEDIVRALAQLKSPSAVEALYEAAWVRHEYLDYDEFFGLARKCAWALADIGTADAFARLQSMAASENPYIAGYARERLDAWSEELHRKGST